jgi:hypothetical protein
MSLDRSRSVKISPHADLKTRGDGSILVMPERAIRLGGSGAEILRLVAEEKNIEAILKAMCTRYPDSSEVTNEILDFLGEMLGLGGIVYLDECLEETSS